MKRHPARPAIEASPSLDALKQIDAICARFEAAWKAGERPSLEDYVVTAPGPLRMRLFWELFQTEQELCLEGGATMRAASLRARFPEYAGIIDSVLGTAGHTDSASAWPVAPGHPGTGSG